VCVFERERERMRERKDEKDFWKENNGRVLGFKSVCVCVRVLDI